MVVMREYIRNHVSPSMSAPGDSPRNEQHSPASSVQVNNSSLSVLSAPSNTRAQFDNTRLYHFGSDNHFVADGFIPPPGTESAADVKNRLTEELLMLKPINRSNHNSRPPTPTGTKKNGDSMEHNFHAAQNASSSRKRGRDDSDAGQPSKRTAPRSPQTPRASSSVKGGSYRSKHQATGSGSKQSRQNLTEQQKRSNHIESEQKRRNQIKESFERLNDLIPELRVASHSKSGVLQETVGFLYLLQETNRKLKNRLEGRPDNAGEDSVRAARVQFPPSAPG